MRVSVIHLLRLLILVSVPVFIFFSCASPTPTPWIHAYQGPRLPDNETATFLHYFSNYKEYLTIDGKHYPKSQNNPRTRFKLVPGKHEFSYYLRWRKKGWVLGAFDADLEAGKTYVLSHKPGGFYPGYLVVTFKNKDSDESIYEIRFDKPYIVGY